MTTLRELVESASREAEEHFDRDGMVERVFIAWKRDGSHGVLPVPPGNKDAIVRAVKKLFKAEDVVRYAFITEAFGAPPGSNARPSEHPDRIELVMISVEDEREGALTGTRTIVRPADGKPYLGPLEIAKASSGRHAGLLPDRGVMQ